MPGIITTYALRDTRALFIPAVILTGTMIVSTLQQRASVNLPRYTGCVTAVTSHDIGRV
jgi:hypothetical protein